MIGKLLQALRGALKLGRTVRPKPAPRHLCLEALEDRSVPAFLAPVTSAGGGFNLTVADFNRDGRADVAVFANDTNDTVTVSLGQSDGTLQKASSTNLAVKDQVLLDFGFADVNGDGKLDLISHGDTLVLQSAKRNGVSNGDPGYYAVYQNVWLGKGDGSFGTRTTTLWYTTTDPMFLTPFSPSNPTSTFADFNHDGILDRATLSTDAVSVSLGNGTGTYQPAQTYAAGPSPGSIAAGDFNGDGLIDLVVVNSPSSSKPTFSVLLNDGSW
jgi:hypothetical protein